MKHDLTTNSWNRALLLVVCLLAAVAVGQAQTKGPVTYNTLKIDDLEIFYREAGDPRKPTILLLHGFPSSSHMFRELIPLLADKYHLVAPDYPGFGHSSAPPASEFTYTFERLAEVIERFATAKGLKKYSLYVQDYGAPVGFRLAVKHPERVQALIVQNGNAYDEGLRGFWNPLKNYWENPTEQAANKLAEFLKVESTKWQYTHGTRNANRISPDTWTFDQALLDRPGNREIQLKLFLDYGSNPPLYPKWQAYFRQHQPPTLIVWGKNDQIFPAEGAEAFKRDLKDLEFHLLDTGHFALEEEGDRIAELIEGFLARKTIR